MLLGASGVYAQSTQNAAPGGPKANQTGSGAAGEHSGAAASPDTQSAQSGTTMGAGQAASASLSRSDRKLVTQLAQANLAEIEAGRIAQGKTQNEQVRNFAQQMIDDHTSALQDLQQLAQAKGVTLPAETDSKHKKITQRLSALSGDEFDRRYIAQSGVSDHKKTHSLLQRIESRAADPDLKALAGKLIPVVDQHLNTVQQLSASAGRGAGSTSSGTSGTSGAAGAGGSTGKETPQSKPGSSY
jgi:putative membrane protein